MYNFYSEQIVLSGMMCPAIATLQQDEEYTSEKEGDPVNSRTPTQTEQCPNATGLLTIAVFWY